MGGGFGGGGRVRIRGCRNGALTSAGYKYTYCRPGCRKFEGISVVKAIADAECVKALLHAKAAQSAALPVAAAEEVVGPMVSLRPGFWFFSRVKDGMFFF